MISMPVFPNFNKETDWIGVDFDGTLNIRDKTKSMNEEELGEPVPSMVETVKELLAAGYEVRIFTARVSKVQKTKDYNIHGQIGAISKWCLDHIGQVLPITCEKDPYMYCMFDDRAYTVGHNTGELLGIPSRW